MYRRFIRQGTIAEVAVTCFVPPMPAVLGRQRGAEDPAWAAAFTGTQRRWRPIGDGFGAAILPAWPRG